MARQLVLANGHLHIGLDEFGQVGDLYFPHIGQESHLGPSSLHHKIGVFVDDKLSWLDDGSWSVRVLYHDNTMVSDIVATNNELGLRLEFTDAVDYMTNTWVRNIHIVNLWDIERNIKLYCHQAFNIAESNTSDSAQYRPDLPAVMHYKGRRIFLASLKYRGGFFDDYSIGLFDISDGSGTFRDAEDGRLSKNLVENGQVDSVLGINLNIPASDSLRAEYYLVAAQTVDDAELLLQQAFQAGALEYLTRTANYWRNWLSQAAIAPSLSPHRKRLLYSSLLAVKAHIDADGAIMASLDGSLRHHPQHDTYNFCWGRDSAYVLWPLVRLGYREEFLNFLEFTKRTISPDGYLEHKYRADGSLGSTWLPYLHPDGVVHPPIQADETAAVLFVAGQYFRMTNDRKMLDRYYQAVLRPMADFLAKFVTDDGLPQPSYDPWEHSYLTHTYTTAITMAALAEAANLAEANGQENDRQTWRQAVDKMRTHSDDFYNAANGYFYKGFIDQGEERDYDETIDSLSLYGAFMFGLVDIRSDKFRTAVQIARDKLSENGVGYSRFERDNYFITDNQPNLWVIVSLWMAQIHIELDEVAEAEKIIDFVSSLASPSGLLPEQVARGSHQQTSLSPLAWSHAEFINTIIDLWQSKEN